MILHFPPMKAATEERGFNLQIALMQLFLQERVQFLFFPIAKHEMQPHFIILIHAAGSRTCGALITL